MNKQTFMWILQVALLEFEGVADKLIPDYEELTPEVIQAGKKLCNYLKSINITSQEVENE